MNQMTIDEITIEVIRKKIKYLRLAVYPPEGKVKIAVPLKTQQDSIQDFILSKLEWIKKCQAKFLAQPRQPLHQYVTGESHYYLGKPYLLNVIYQPGRARVVLRNDAIIDLHIKEGSHMDQRQRLMTQWYRQQIDIQILPLIKKWEAIMGVTIKECRVRQMKTRWGSCNIKERRIWLNIELIQKPLHCLEYVIVHELVHLLERTHNHRFVRFMDQFLPKWQACKKELNRSCGRSLDA